MKLTKPVLSVITPCFNSEHFLGETLDCLLSQTFKEWECILVNDGSTDHTLDIIKEYVSNDNRFSFIDKQNEGPSIARNVAVAASHGKYILPLDSDDLIASTYLEKAVSYFEGHPETRLVYGMARFFGDVEEPWPLGEYKFEYMIWDNHIFNSAVYKKEDFDRVGGYNPNMKGGLEDWNFLLSILDQKAIVYQIPEVMYFYRRHGLTRGAVADLHQEELNRLIVQNHPELYQPFFQELINWHNGYRNYKCRYECIVNSVPYKIVCFVVAPAKWLLSLVKTVKR